MIVNAKGGKENLSDNNNNNNNWDQNTFRIEARTLDLPTNDFSFNDLVKKKKNYYLLPRNNNTHSKRVIEFDPVYDLPENREFKIQTSPSPIRTKALQRPSRYFIGLYVSHKSQVSHSSPTTTICNSSVCNTAQRFT